MLSRILPKSAGRFLAAAAVATIGMMSPVSAAESLPQGVAAKLTRPDRIESLLFEEKRERVRVIVEFAMPAIPDAAQASDATAADAAREAAVHQVQDSILDRVFGSEAALNGAAASDKTNIKRMSYSPMFAATVDRETLERLAADPAVVRIHEDSLSKPMLDDTLPLIGMPTAFAGGATGRDFYVVVLDSGARRKHKFLDGKVHLAGCFSTNDSSDPERIVTSLCPGGVESSGDIDSANDCDPEEARGCGHGTHVSGIVAGWNKARLAGEPASGVARDAQLISMNVYSKMECPYQNYDIISVTTPEPEPAYCLVSFASDQISALELIYTLRGGGGVRVVNLSAGDLIVPVPSEGTYCDDDSRKPIIDMLRDVGVATVVPAGNTTYGRVTAPGCISTAVTVAASTKSDTIPNYSGWGTGIDLVAPGGGLGYINEAAGILSSHSESDSAFREAIGTSMAAAHVSGAFTALLSAVPSATVEQIEEALERTGTGITHTPEPPGDERLAHTAQAITKPRINVAAALTLLRNPDKPAEIVSPEPGSTLTSWSKEFSWSVGTNVGEYWLYVGSRGVGSANIFASSTGSATSTIVEDLPSDGSLEVRLWSKIGADWRYNDYTYTLEPGEPEVYSPTPGTELGSAATFDWTQGAAGTRYRLDVGTDPDDPSDIHDGEETSDLSAVVTGLPSSGTIHARLSWSTGGGAWSSRDYTYTGGQKSKAVMISPPPGTPIGEEVTFQWTEGAGVDQYWIQVGSREGSAALFNRNAEGSTTARAMGLPTSGTVFVRLWSLISGSWEYIDYSYEAREENRSVMLSPAPGSEIGYWETFQWTQGTGVAANWLYVGTEGIGSYNVLDKNPGKENSFLLRGTGDRDQVFVRLWSLIEGTWEYNDYKYKASMFSVVAMREPSPGSAIGSSANFIWELFLFPSKTWLYVGSTGPGSADIYNQETSDVSSVEVVGLPSNGAIYVRLWAQSDSLQWRYRDYTYQGGGVTRAALRTPRPGGYHHNSESIRFSWTEGLDASQYWLYVGSKGVGTYDIFNQSTGDSTSVDVSGFPEEGTVHVRLWSLIEDVWYSKDYEFSVGSTY